MREKTPPTVISDTEDQVRLKPVLGLRPGVYLAIIYSVILLLVLFFILLYPGIVKPGSMLVFSSEPSGAALRVDGVYMGSSPCRVFVPKGARVLDMVLPGFTNESIECEIPGRLFASRFFPRLYEVSVVLNTPDPAAALAMAALDYAAWTFGGEPTAAWQAPLSLSEGVYRVGAAGADADGVITAAARFAVTRASLRDLVRAKILNGNGGIPPSPLSLVRSVSEIVDYLAGNPAGAAWLADTLPADSAAVLISSDWYQKQLAAFAGITVMEELSAPPGAAMDPAPPAAQIRVGGLLFTGIGGGSLVQGEPFPRLLPVEPFLICATEVPVPAYEDFIDANPRWRPEQRDVLESQGLATAEYLDDFGSITPGGSRTGISAVSWFAAQAFCQWLSGKLPDSLSGWEIRLPTEAEWEFAAKSVQQWGSRGGIYASDGITWEWCADPYSPLPFLTAPPDAVNSLGSPERSVRGGTWLNATISTSLETRASLPPESCSPFVSFRPVIAMKAAGL